MKMLLQLLAFVISIAITPYTLAEDVTQVINGDSEKTPPSSTLNFATTNDLAQHIEDKIQSYYTTIETLVADKDIAALLSHGDSETLAQQSHELQQQLPDSILVRLYPRGQEKVDNDSTPACGYACVDIVKDAYNKPPQAEALLYNSPDANITLVRAIWDSPEHAVGAVVVHYPYKLIKDSVKSLQEVDLYTEFRQSVSGISKSILQHGDSNIKQGSAQEIIRIKNTKWNIAVWAPAGIEIDKNEAPSIPWQQVGVVAFILITGILILIIYRKKHPAKSKIRADEIFNPESTSYDDGDKNPTLIMGGGASDVDVSEYLKNTDIKANINKPK